MTNKSQCPCPISTQHNVEMARDRQKACLILFVPTWRAKKKSLDLTEVFVGILFYLECMLHELWDVVHAGVSLPPALRVVRQLRHPVKIPLQGPEIFLIIQSWLEVRDTTDYSVIIRSQDVLSYLDGPGDSRNFKTNESESIQNHKRRRFYNLMRELQRS